MEYEVIYNGADEEGIEVKNMLQDLLNIVSESVETKLQVLFLYPNESEE